MSTSLQFYTNLKNSFNIIYYFLLLFYLLVSYIFIYYNPHCILDCINDHILIIFNIDYYIKNHLKSIQPIINDHIVYLS
jgi:hypothetical protein